MKTLFLNDNWKVGEESLSRDAAHAAYVLNYKKDWYETNLPADVRIPLLREGIIEEPLERMNCYDSEWIENRSWWFMKTFALTWKDLDSPGSVNLVLDYVDIYGDVFLNGVFLGCHKSVHYPFSVNVSGKLKEGNNTLLVRVTTGLERIGSEVVDDGVCTEKSAARGDRGDYRRNKMRKPQYVFGWDWGPRVATVGLGEVRLEFFCEDEVVDAMVYTAFIGKDKAELKLEYEVFHNPPLTTGEVYVEVVIVDSRGNEVFRERNELFLRSGRNYTDKTIILGNPDLWWPRGYGAQTLYKLIITCGESRYETRFGIRTLRLNMDKADTRPGGPSHGDRLFAFEVNGVSIFARGANWIPADSIWQRVADEKYRALVGEAAELNFTMLRVWGGGIYEKECFYEACDESGIMVWQDFMFGCALVPDEDEGFRELVSHEIDYQIMRLRNHASLVLWCGNNENQWIFRNNTGYLGGSRIYNEMIPRTVRNLSPHIPYWPSSPFGGGTPNSSIAGDCHYWHEAMMHPDMEKRIDPFIYDESDHKFISEYGYVGPCARESIEKFFAGEPIRREGDIWNHHNNTFEKDTVAAGIRKHYTSERDLSLDEYIHYAGMVQGLMYSYSLESFRFNPCCGGGLFWMFNDTWGETGWTVIDYYLNRKISFPFVRRALKPVKLIMRESGGKVKVVLCNDECREVKGDLEYGWISRDGVSSGMESRPIYQGARSQGVVLEFDKPAGNPGERVICCRLMGDREDTALLWESPVLSLDLTTAEIAVEEVERSGYRVVFDVSSERFAHAVHFGLGSEIKLSDEYFDLLPGTAVRIVAEGEGIPALEEIRKGTGDFTFCRERHE